MRDRYIIQKKGGNIKKAGEKKPGERPDWNQSPYDGGGKANALGIGH